MLEDEVQLKHSITTLAKQYGLIERIATSSIGYADTREAEIMGIQSMIRQIEREVAVYLAAKYNLWKQDEAEVEEPLARELAPLQKAA